MPCREVLVDRRENYGHEQCSDDQGQNQPHDQLSQPGSSEPLRQHPFTLRRTRWAEWICIEPRTLTRPHDRRFRGGCGS
jgi:hypothetical protein